MGIYPTGRISTATLIFQPFFFCQFPLLPRVLALLINKFFHFKQLKS